MSLWFLVSIGLSAFPPFFSAQAFTVSTLLWLKLLSFAPPSSVTTPIFNPELLEDEFPLDDLEEHPTIINAADKTTAINENTFFINKKSPLFVYCLYLNNTTLSLKLQ